MPKKHLLKLAHESGNPVIDGNTATLVWEGNNPPHVIDDSHEWNDAPQTMGKAGKGLWAYTFTLPLDAYLEYAFLDPENGGRLPDPLNPNHIYNGIDAFNNFFYMPEGKAEPHTHKRRSISRGLVTRHQVVTQDYAVGWERTVYFYRPAVRGPVPLVIVYDGTDYLRRGKLNIIVDNLIADKRIRPIAMALVQNGGQARTLEYSCSEVTLAFINECILPEARKNLALVDPKVEPYGVIGASMGGLMALFTGLRMPKIFGKVISQSGAFDSTEYEPILIDLIRYTPKPDIRIWMDAGQLEFLMEANRQMHSLLKDMKYKVEYREFPAGHNYTAWRNDISHGLVALFGK